MIYEAFSSVVLLASAEHVIRQVSGGRAGIEKVTVIDTSQDMLDRIKVRGMASRHC